MGVIGNFRARGRVFNLMELSFAESIRRVDPVFVFHKRGMVGNSLDLSQSIFPLDIIFF